MKYQYWCQHIWRFGNYIIIILYIISSNVNRCLHHSRNRYNKRIILVETFTRVSPKNASINIIKNVTRFLWLTYGQWKVSTFLMYSSFINYACIWLGVSCSLWKCKELYHFLRKGFYWSCDKSHTSRLNANRKTTTASVYMIFLYRILANKNFNTKHW